MSKGWDYYENDSKWAGDTPGPYESYAMIRNNRSGELWFTEITDEDLDEEDFIQDWLEAYFPDVDKYVISNYPSDYTITISSVLDKFPRIYNVMVWSSSDFIII